MSSSVLFWSIVGLLSAIGAAGIVWAFVRQPDSREEQTRSETTRDLLREELALLKDEHERGHLSDELYEQSVQDVERRALQEIEQKTQSSPQKKLPVWTGVAVGCASVLLAVVLYLQLGSPKLVPFIDEVRQEGLLNPDGTLAQNDRQLNPEHLKAYLADNGEDERALVLYARLMVERQNWNEAVRVYKQAVELNRLVANDTEVLLEYVAACISSRIAENQAPARTVLYKILEADPKQYRAREMLAILAIETQQWGEALPHLEALLTLLSMDDPVYQRIAQTILQVQRLQERQEQEAR
ncbi:MAG: c-type cytochrome biogenesis protein CcmI [Duodenibacillus sp.]|nr:c-type cytochrome biogenesis protein CcmI [Duodenibacillus sp.]